jgi:pSer/pThr/pTyr-binding forkhead associated (FHA) protein
MSQDTAESLLVVAGQAKGTLIPIPHGELLLGRETGTAGLLGDDPMLSRRHARVARDDQGRLFVEDLGSTNGTILNGTRIDGPEWLEPRDVIEVGGTRLQVLFEPPAG